MKSRNLRIAKQWIGDSHPCFITFEAGPTHDSVESAIALVNEAAKSGANAIKFQIFDADKLVEDKKQHFSYSILINKSTGETKEVSEPLYDILKRRQLTKEEWAKVKAVSDSLGLAFFATIGFEEDLKLITSLDVHSVKIASSDVNHFPLLRLAARSALNVQIDTGNSELEEIDAAVRILEEEGCSSIIIHQCPSGYPARIPSICLNMIKTLRTRYPHYPIAYSDHTPDADMDIAAVALGVNLIEKTITFDRTTPSVEHIFSLEPPDMKKFISRIRDIELARGDSNRVLSNEQKQLRNKTRRGAYLTKDVTKGDIVTIEDVIFRRPCNGIPPNELDHLIQEGCRFSRNLKTGEQLHTKDINSN